MLMPDYFFPKVCPSRSNIIVFTRLILVFPSPAPSYRIWYLTSSFSHSPTSTKTTVVAYRPIWKINVLVYGNDPISTSPKLPIPKYPYRHENTPTNRTKSRPGSLLRNMPLSFYLLQLCFVRLDSAHYNTRYREWRGGNTPTQSR